MTGEINEIFGHDVVELSGPLDLANSWTISTLGQSSTSIKTVGTERAQYHNE